MLLDLVHHIRQRLESIRELTLNLREPGCLPETIDSTIEEAESTITSLTNFLRASTPLRKENTVNTLVEKSLKKHRRVLERKRAKVFKRLEMGLPETTVPEVPLGYILDSLVEFASMDLSHVGTLAVVTKSSSASGQRGHVEILLVFTGQQRDPSEAISGLQLHLVKQTVLSNRGIMELETDKNLSRTKVKLAFPVERRSLACYSGPQ